MELQISEQFYLKAIKSELSRRIDQNPAYSLRAFSKACKLSPGVLSQILSGKRIPSYKVAQKILFAIDLTQLEQEQFLNSLAQLHQSRGLKRLNPQFKSSDSKLALQPKELSLDLFRVIGDWYHYALLMLTYVEGFVSSPKWMAAQIGISEIEAKLALERLIEVGLLKKEKGQYVALEGHFTTSDKHMTNAALKRHTKQSLEKAITSLENDPIEIRSMTYMTMAIDESKISEAKKLVEAFTNEMSALLESGQRTRVYEFGIYLYPLQKTEFKKTEGEL